MKRIFSVVAFVCLLTCSSFASTIPVTGTISLPDGSKLTGTVRLTLSYSAARDTTNNNVVVAQSVLFRVQQGTLQSSAQIVPNDVLQPANTWYTAEYFTSSGARVAQAHFYISGQTFDLGSATPTPATTSNLNFGYFTGLTNVTTASFNNRATCQRSGASAGVKIVAALAAVSSGGIADCTDLQGAQSITQNITIPAGVTLLLGAATFTISTNSQIKMSSSTALVGLGPELTVIKSTETGDQNGVITNADLTNGNTNLKVTDLTIQRTQVKAASFFELIKFKNSQYVWIERTRGIMVGTSAGSGKGYHCEGCTYVWIDHNYLENGEDSFISMTWSGVRSNGYASIDHNDFKLSGNWVHSSILVTADHATVTGNTLAAGAGFVANLVELGDAVDDVSIDGNISINANLLLARSGTNFRITNNQVFFASTGGGGINLDSAGGVQSGHTVIGNRIQNGRIRVVKTTNAIHDILISGNEVSGSSGANYQVDAGASGVTLTGNYAYGGVNGFYVSNAPGITVTNNVSSGASSDGFLVELITTTGSTVAANASNGSGGYGYKIDQPQSFSFLDNNGTGNTSGLINVLNATVQGPVPFGNVRFTDTTCGGNFYGNPGSTCSKTNGGLSTGLYVKGSANTAQNGWYPAPSMVTGTGTLTFGTVNANTAGNQNVTVTGAAAGDSCYATPADTPGVGLMWSAWVSAGDTVTVRLGNITTGNVASTDRSWRVDCRKN